MKMTTTSNYILLKNMKIYAGNQIIEHGYIKMENGKITAIGDVESLKTDDNDYTEVIVPENFTAVPGFIDMHIHGVNGADTMDATNEALDTMTESLPKEGTTSFLATTMTQSVDAIEKALRNVGDYIKNGSTPGKAEIVGVHLEGPFVNSEKAGAQPEEFMINPDIEIFEEWQKLTNNMIKLVTVAPELPGGLPFVRHLNNHGVIASIGHTNATYDQVVEAIDAGATHVTHLYNQMRGLHHREPGVVGAAYLHEELKAEMIVDGVHVHPKMVKLAYEQKHDDGLILVTDAMRAKCLANGTYDLGGQDVHVKDGRATLADGTLAGSILKLGQAVKNMIEFTGCSLKETIQMASVNPAVQLNIFERKGSIEVGKDADIVILDDQLNVYYTFCLGKLAYEKRDTI